MRGKRKDRIMKPDVYYHGLAPSHTALASPVLLVIFLAVLAAVLAAGSFTIRHLHRTVA